MMITKKIIRLSNVLISIPKECKRIWDCSENRWGYKYENKIKNGH
jgi:hypothetical protein